jgi:hypothetical protein
LVERGLVLPREYIDLGQSEQHERPGERISRYWDELGSLSPESNRVGPTTQGTVRAFGSSPRPTGPRRRFCCLTNTDLLPIAPIAPSPSPRVFALTNPACHYEAHNEHAGAPLPSDGPLQSALPSIWEPKRFCLALSSNATGMRAASSRSMGEGSVRSRFPREPIQSSRAALSP